jgi:hypothetical protein
LSECSSTCLPTPDQTSCLLSTKLPAFPTVQGSPMRKQSRALCDTLLAQGSVAHCSNPTSQRALTVTLMLTLQVCGAMRMSKTLSPSSRALGLLSRCLDAPSSGKASCKLRSLSTGHERTLPMRALLQEISSKLGLGTLKTSLVRSTVFEDNQGCLSLVNVAKMSQRNKYLALKYHFFSSHMGKSKAIVAKYINTKEQKANIFTKGLPGGQFQVIRKLLIGW